LTKFQEIEFSWKYSGLEITIYKQRVKET